MSFQKLDNGYLQQNLWITIPFDILISIAHCFLESSGCFLKFRRFSNYSVSKLNFRESVRAEYYNSNLFSRQTKSYKISAKCPGLANIWPVIIIRQKRRSCPDSGIWMLADSDPDWPFEGIYAQSSRLIETSTTWSLVLRMDVWYINEFKV